MRKIIIAFLLVIYSLCGYSLTNTVITGWVANSNDSTATLIISNPGLFTNPSSVIETKVKNGKFQFSFEIFKPSVIFISLNQDNIFLPGSYYILVEPGDNISIKIPHLEDIGILDLTFSGRGHEKMEIFKALRRSFLEGPKQVKPTYRQSLEEFLLTTETWRLNLGSAIQASRNSVKPEIAELIYSIKLGALYDTFFIKFMGKSLRDTSTIKQSFYKNLNNSGLINYLTKDDAVYYLETTHVLNNYALIDYSFKTGSVTPPTDIRFTEPNKFYSIVSDFYNSYPKVKNYLLGEFLCKYISAVGLTNNLDSLSKRYFAEFGQNDFITIQVKSALQFYKQNSSHGLPFLNFSLQDTSGQYIQLSDFKGKTVVLDFYFNGCVGCRQIKPYLEVLEKKYESDDVVFVSISIDKTKDLFLKGVGIYCSSYSKHLYTNGEGSSHELIKKYNIESYPTLFVIDGQGKIVDRGPDPRIDNGQALTNLINQALMKQ